MSSLTVSIFWCSDVSLICSSSGSLFTSERFLLKHFGFPSLPGSPLSQLYQWQALPLSSSWQKALPLSYSYFCQRSCSVSQTLRSAPSWAAVCPQALGLEVCVCEKIILSKQMPCKILWKETKGIWISNWPMLEMLIFPAHVDNQSFAFKFRTIFLVGLCHFLSIFPSFHLNEALSKHTTNIINTIFILLVYPPESVNFFYITSLRNRCRKYLLIFPNGSAIFRIKESEPLKGGTLRM